MIVILTGQPGSGKTTIARGLAEEGFFVVDGDQLRDVAPQGYDRQGRLDNVANAHLIARYASREGFWVVVALVQPYAEQRDLLKSEGAFEVHLVGKPGERPPEYAVADYEAPEKPDLIIDTDQVGEDEAIRTVYRAVANLP